MGKEIRKKVSCHVITFNHKDFISDCIEGILMQKTDFDFEVIIGDDVSTDGTRQIVEKYKQDYPDKIILNLRPQRGRGIPGKENYISTLDMCNGEFITLCDGDDYWTDPLKLQKQVDFLESNPDCALCGHRSLLKFFDENTPDRIEGLSVKSTGNISAERIISGEISMSNVTMMFRSRVIKPIPKLMIDTPYGDVALQLLCASHGDIAYLDDIMSVYRRGVPGAWSESERSDKAIDRKRWAENRINSFKECFELFNEHTNFKYEVLLKERLAKLKVASLLSMQDYSTKLEVIEAIFKNGQSFLQFKSGNEINTLIRLIFGPKIYNKLSRLKNKL